MTSLFESLLSASSVLLLLLRLLSLRCTGVERGFTLVLLPILVGNALTFSPFGTCCLSSLYIPSLCLGALPPSDFYHEEVCLVWPSQLTFVPPRTMPSMLQLVLPLPQICPEFPGCPYSILQILLGVSRFNAEPVSCRRLFLTALHVRS